MEIMIPKAKIIKFIAALFFVISCSAQKNKPVQVEKVYDLINHHYKLSKNNSPARFLYYKTLSIADDPLFSWTKTTTLSEYLADDRIVNMKCSQITEILSLKKIKELDEKFSQSPSVFLDGDKLASPVLNNSFLQKQTYTQAPDAANRMISFPILIRENGSLYGIFAENAHNEGGSLYIYEFVNNSWRLICRDMLWLV